MKKKSKEKRRLASKIGIRITTKKNIKLFSKKA